MKPLLKVLVTCGPTREPLDPVRFLSNRSTGTLGFELARAFTARGHRVVLAAGPVDVPADVAQNRKIKLVRFETARELHRITLQEFKTCDAVCMTAAVADFRPKTPSSAKLKRGRGTLTVELVPNPDILADLGRRKKSGQALVGFSVETERLEARAHEKFSGKNLDFLAAQDLGRQNPFGNVRMQTLLVSKSGATALRGISKRDLAKRIALEVQALLT